ncbi:alpha/beta hydrolase [Streptomyces sp. NPDC060064]|uniref:alpha/beta hydrolase n=1 Tax=Streptomyces sp. NPDC060064 TaxID=3347049 RepID=UPI00369B9B3B
MNGSETLATYGAFFNPTIRAPISDLLAAGVGFRPPGASKTTRAVAPAVRSYKAIAGCLGWPTPAKPVKAGAPVHGAPPALILQSTHQALAPHRAGAAMAAQLPGSVVLGREGDDYSMFLVSECVQKATNRYLTTRALPAPGTTCTD